MSTYTITPSISYDEQGREIVSYDNAYIDDGNYREYVRENFNRDNSWQDDLYYQRSDGSIGHRYADLDGDIYETFEGDYQQEAELDDYLEGADDTMTDEDIATLYDSVGGYNTYQEMISWARHSGAVDEGFIANFDNHIDEGDIEGFQVLLRNLYEHWIENRTEYNDYSDYRYDDDDYDESYDSDIVEVTPDFLQAVGDNYPDYLDATAWAAQYLDESVIEQFDYTIDYGTLQQKAEAIDWLMNNYRTHN